MLAPHTRVIRLMAHLVMVGHTQKVEATFDGPREHFRRPGISVGVQRVAVQVTAQPAGLGSGVHINWLRRDGLCWMRRAIDGRSRIRKSDLDLVLATTR